VSSVPRHLPHRATLGLVLAALVLGQLALPTTVSADNGSVSTASTTYVLNPKGARLDVTIDVTVKNTSPDTVRYVPCTQYELRAGIGYVPVQGTCPQRTQYYFNQSFVVIEDGATNVKVSADRGSASIRRVDNGDGWDQFRIDHSAIYYGQTRKLHVTYRLPGGKPRSDSWTRIGAAFASFCMATNGIDGGRASVIVPAGYDFEVDAHGGSFKSTTNDGRTTYTTGLLDAPHEFWACFTGDNPDGYATSQFTSPSGRRIELQAWPEDSTWNDEIRTSIDAILTELEGLVGRGLPGSGTIVIREVSSAELGAYAGVFDWSEGIARVGEDSGQVGIVAHELSHAWFNGELFDTTWLSEGYAEWAEAVVADEACEDPGRYPGDGSPKISAWVFAGPKSNEQELDVITYQYAAACQVVSTMAERIGNERMREVLDALFERELVYLDGTAPQSDHAGLATWRDWLDAVDEVGLLPAGEADLDFAQDLILRYGVTTDRDTLDKRAAARAAYHELADEVDEWTLPEAVRRPMGRWRFGDATASMDALSGAYAYARDVEEALPEIDPFDGPVREMVETAKVTSDLEAAEARAGEQLDSAEEVAAAKAALAAPQDLLGQIGLIGTDLQPALTSAIAAVETIDTAEAHTSAELIQQTLRDAPQLGLTRVAVIVGVVLAIVLLVILVAVVVRRRRSRVRLASAGAMAAAAALPVIEAVPAVGVADGAPDALPAPPSPAEPGG